MSFHINHDLLTISAHLHFEISTFIIDQFLEDAGTDKSQILSVTIYLKDIEKDYAAFNEIWDMWVADIEDLPRTCVEAKLYDPRVMVELTVTAVRAAN